MDKMWKLLYLVSHTLLRKGPDTDGDRWESLLHWPALTTRGQQLVSLQETAGGNVDTANQETSSSEFFMDVFVWCSSVQFALDEREKYGSLQ